MHFIHHHASHPPISLFDWPSFSNRPQNEQDNLQTIIIIMGGKSSKEEGYKTQDSSFFFKQMVARTKVVSI